MEIICKKCGNLILGGTCNLCILKKNITKAVFKGLFEGLSEFLIPDKQCNNCGITWKEISQTGKLGCANDYVIFQEELKVFLRNYHGTDKHMI